MNEQILTKVLISQENMLATIRRCMLWESIFLTVCGLALIFLVVKGLLTGTYFKINLLLIIAIILGCFSLIKTYRLYEEHVRYLIEFCIKIKYERGSNHDDTPAN